MALRLFLGLGVGAAALTLAITAFATGREENAPFDHISNEGVPVTALPAREAEVLQSGGAEPALSLLGSREGLSFYTAPASEGGTCFGMGASKTGRVGVLFCPHAGSDPAAFPSRATPILDLSGQAFGREGTIYLSLAGFAADGVDSVALMDTAGAVYKASVAENIYARRDLPNRAARALLAFDSDGGEVFRRDLSRRRLR